MKDGRAGHFRVVITEEEGYSGKLEKQVRRISIAPCSVICLTEQFVSFNEEAETSFWLVTDRTVTSVTSFVPETFKICLSLASLVSPYRLDIGRDGLGYIVLLFSHFFAVDIQCTAPNIRLRRQAPVIILRHT
jgi:hypothetical protein